MQKHDVDREGRIESVEILSQTKLQAENRVKYARSLMEDGEIDKDELRNIHLLYDEARSQVNASIEGLVFELELTGKEAADAYPRVAKKAAEQVSRFLSATDAFLFAENRSAGAVEALSSLADSLVNALVDVWKTLRDEKAQKRSILITRINTYKWVEFDRVK